MGKHYHQLSLEERCSIARLRESGQSIRQIASALDRAPSTVSRELRRNLTYGRRLYRPGHANDQAWARRWRGSRLERHPALQAWVLDRLAMGWSPQQVAGRMALEQHDIRVSHESIYRFIYAQYRRTDEGRWRLYLPRAKFKRGFRGRRGGSPVQHIKHRVPVSERPKAVEGRRQRGHWEADLLMMSDKKRNLLVLQERTSRYAFLSWQVDKKTTTSIPAIARHLRSLPQNLRRTITFDNGTEFADHHHLNTEPGIDSFFCDPRKPWQKGGVENLNGRIRRFVPGSTNPDDMTPEAVALLQDIINSTPRKCLGYRTPHEAFFNPLHFKCESTYWPSPV